MQFFKDNSLTQNLKNAFLYFGSSFVQLFIGLFTTPIFARYLSERDFAIMGYFGSVTAFFLPVFTLCFNYFYLMKYFRQSEQENDNTFINLLVFLTFSNLFLIVVSYLVIWLYFYLAHVSLPFYPFALIILITCFFEVYRTFLLIDFRMKKKAGSYFMVSMIYVVLNFSFGLILVVTFRAGAAGRLFGTFLSLLVVSVIIFFYIRKNLRFRIDFAQIRDAFKFSWPVILGSYAYYPIMNMDKIYLERIHNIKEFGLYNIGFTFGSYLLVMATALYQAFEPDWFKFVTKHNKAKFIQSALVFLGIIGVFLVAFLFTSKEFVYLLTAGRYQSAYVYANVNAISVLFLSITMILNAVLLSRQQTTFILYINVVIGLLSLFVYKYFIATWSFQGANYARIVIFGSMVLVQLFFLKFPNTVSRLKFSVPPPSE